MSKIYSKVKPNISVKEAVRLMQDKHQSCVLVVDGEDYLEGIVTFGDIRRHGFFSPSEGPINGGEPPAIADVNTLFLFVCFLGLVTYYFTAFAINTQYFASTLHNLPHLHNVQELVFCKKKRYSILKIAI